LLTSSSEEAITGTKSLIRISYQNESSFSIVAKDRKGVLQALRKQKEDDSN
jgi:hypothetical protein